MPKQGQSVESCILTELRVKKGDKVKPGDVLFAYETDKASFEEEARESGEVLEIFFGEGDEIPVLANVLVIGSAGETVDEFRSGNAPATHVKEETTMSLRGRNGSNGHSEYGGTGEANRADIKPAIIFNENSAAVSPRARKMAERYDIDTSRLKGSGPGGRVITKDVVAAIEVTPRVTPLASAQMKAGGLQAPAAGSGLAGTVRAADLTSGTAKPATANGESYVKPLTNMRKLIARAMHASLQNSAQLTHHLGADARRIMELRRDAKAKGVNITINDLVCWAVVRALEKFPNVNSHFLGIEQGMRYFSGVHLALAVDTDRGLMVPVVRNAEKLSITGLAGNLREVAEACRKGSINPDLLSPEAASFTVSNLGNYGVEIFTPVINLPQSAILGVNAIVPRPKDLGGGVYGFVPFIGLSLTYDHRALDGGEATRFVKQIALEIENLEIEF